MSTFAEDMLGVATGGISSVFDTGLNIAQYYATSAIDHKYWQKRYDITRTDYLADRQHQEEYNSPSNQMKLLAEAGLNPNLIYGKFGGVGSSGTSSAQQQQAQLGRGSSSTSDIALKAAALSQRQQHLAQIDGISAQAELDRAQAENIRTQTNWYGSYMQSAIDLNKATMEKYYADAKLSADQSQLTLLQGALTEAQTAFTNGQIGLQEFLRENIIAQTGMFSAQEDYYQDAARLNEIDYDLKTFQRDLNNAIRSAGGVDKIAQNQLNTLSEQFKILQARASVEGNKVMQWIEHIAPVLVDATEAGKNTSDAVLNWTKRNDSKNSKGLAAGAISGVAESLGDNISTDDMIKLLKLLVEYGS